MVCHFINRRETAGLAVIMPSNESRVLCVVFPDKGRFLNFFSKRREVFAGRLTDERPERLYVWVMVAPFGVICSHCLLEAKFLLW